MAVSIKDVARVAGVSSATVSRVLSDKPHVRPAVKERVRAAVENLGYQPNRVARSLRVQRSKVIGLIISDIQNSFFNTVVRAIEDTAQANGYAVFLSNSDEDPEKERLYLDLFRAEHVAGVILTPTRAQVAACDDLLKAGIPVVSVDRRLELAVDTVLTDNVEASHNLVRTLLAQGHRRIGAVLPNLSITTGQDRFAGYSAALSEAGISVQKSLVRSGRPVVDDGFALTRQLLELPSPPTALFIGTKLMTLGALRAFYERGLSVPGDIALAAFDKLDWMPYMPPHSYAEQPTYALGERAAQLLLERIEAPAREPQTLILSSSLHTVPGRGPPVALSPQPS